MNPMLSIIIPCYNGEKYLAEAVNSVLKQPCKDVEIIIVDDGSKDSSGIIADKLAAEHDNNRVFHKPNGGVSTARNVGIDHATGRYIGFLDADDVLCRDAYDQKVYSDLGSGQYDIFSFSYMKGMEDLSYGCMMYAGTPGLYLQEDQNYRWQAMKCFCSYLYRRTLFTDKIRFPSGIRYCEDMCFLFLISRSAEHIMQYEKPFMIYRMNFSSVMHSEKKSNYVLEEIDAWEWCRQNSTRQKDISDCEGNIFAYMVEYIQCSCMNGVSVEEIRKNVLKKEPFRKAMEHYGTFWLNEQTAQLYSDFIKSPRKIWLKYRVKGFAKNTASRFIRTKLGNVINQKLRYNVDLKDYLSV